LEARNAAAASLVPDRIFRKTKKSIRNGIATEVRRIRGVKAWNGAFDKPISKGQVLAAFIVG
jgi:hypothetical protein